MFNLGGFGFGRLNGSKNGTSLPAAGRGESPAILVTREDIYRTSRNREPVLLLKKGSEVEAGDLPKFIKNGARASQFQLKIPPVSEPAFQRNHADLGSTNPLTETFSRLARSRKRVLVLERDQKNLKRMIDCLFLNGFSLDHIHPVRVPDHLNWAVNKHQPHVLVVDYNLGDSATGLSLIQGLKGFSGIEQVILTVSPRGRTEAEDKLLHKLCAEKHIRILLKPVNRFALEEILNG